MFSGFIDRIGVNTYIRKLNNKMLKDMYLKTARKNPKTHMDCVIVQCCVKEMNKRGIIV